MRQYQENSNIEPFYRFKSYVTQLVNLWLIKKEIISSQCEGRVATSQRKQGIWFLLLPDRENTGNLL